MKEKKKTKILPIVLFVLLFLILCISLLLHFYRTNTVSIAINFQLNTPNKYLVKTSLGRLTMQTDGGSHYEQYYEIDFSTQVIKRCEDSYSGPKNAYEYREKVLNEKKLSSEESAKLKSFLDTIIAQGGSSYENSNNSNDLFASSIIESMSFYTISTQSEKEIKMGNKDDINTFLSLIGE